MSTKRASSLFSLMSHAGPTATVGPLLMLIAAFLYSVVDGLLKSLGPPYRAWDIAFYRFGCGMVILLLVFGRHRNLFRCNNRRLMFLRGFVGCMAFMTQILAIRLIPISNAMVLFYAYPAFAALFSAVLFKEKISKELVWVFVALGGVAVFFDFKLEAGLLGQAISLLGAAFAGVAVASIKKLRESNGPVEIYLYFCLTGTIITVFPFAAHPQLPASPHELLIVGGIVGVSLVAQLIMNQGFKYCKSWEGGLCLMSEVVFVSLWGILFLQETVNWHFWVGGPIIVGSIAALNFSRSRAQARLEISLPASEEAAAKG